MNTLRFHDTGKPGEVLQLEDLSLEPLADGEVRLKILAAPLNPADLNFIEGTYGVKPELPAVPGIEGCGEVVESRDASFRIGDRAILLRRAGTWATHVQLPADQLFRLPDEIDPVQAAMLKVNPATAWQLLTGFADLDTGSWIVQNAANSAVGRCVITLAKSLGIRTINLVRREELREELLALGADHVLVEGDTTVNEAKELLGKERPKLAFNCVGGESALRLMSLLGVGGIHITYGAMARRPVTVPNGMLIFKDIQVRGLWVSRWVETASTEELRRVYGNLAQEIAAGTLSMPVDSTFRLEDFSKAIERLDSPERNGKVLLVPA